MTTANMIVRTLTSALNVPRLLVVLALAIALLALPAFSPDDASALRTSEQKVRRACYNAGGSIHYEFEGSSFSTYSMTCSLPSGTEIECYSIDSGPFANLVNCQ
jgi:hypothetical protein